MNDDSTTLPSPPALPAACTFFRSVFDDPDLSDHDLTLVLDHAAACAECGHEIGLRIGEATKELGGHAS